MMPSNRINIYEWKFYSMQGTQLEQMFRMFAFQKKKPDMIYSELRVCTSNQMKFV